MSVRRRQEGKRVLPRGRRSDRASHLLLGTGRQQMQPLAPQVGEVRLPPKVKKHAGTQERGLPSAPSPTQQTDKAQRKSCRALGQQLLLTMNSVLCINTAMAEQPWPHTAVLEDISRARRVGVRPAPHQAAVHGGPCLPGPATKPPTT